MIRIIPPTLDQSTFSLHFKFLVFHGIWTREKDKNQIYYTIYQVACTIGRFMLCLLMILYLFKSSTTFKKTSWSLCIIIMFIGATVKTLNVYRNHGLLNKLRFDLHEDSIKRNNPEDIVIQKLTLKEFNILRYSYYGTFMAFSPIWLATKYFSYLWGEREFPLPLYLPFDVNTDNDSEYIPIYLLMSVIGLIETLFIVECQMAMYSIPIQISREYQILIKDVRKLQSLYGNNKGEKRSKILECNPDLQRLKAAIIIRELATGQQRLTKYTEIFEKCYNRTMMMQISTTSIMVVFNAIVCIMASTEFAPEILFQLALLSIVVTDNFLLCWYSQKLSTQCTEVGNALYSCNWHEMDPKMRRDLSLMILRSQRPPKITAAKILELNLSTFALIIKHIFSWLTLYLQLELNFS